MKYIIELEKIEGTNLWRAKGSKTLVFDSHGINNILKPYEEPVDWSKVPVDTLIEVSHNGACFGKRYFACCKDGDVYAWNDGTTSKTALYPTDYQKWEYARLVVEE